VTSPAGRCIAVRQNAGLDASEIPLTGIHDVVDGGVAVSRSGSLAAVTVTDPRGHAVIFVSVYSRWESAPGVIYADANAHRILSDLSVLLTAAEPAHNILVAGDWNLLYGYNEAGWPAYWKQRYDTVFSRAELLGLKYMGPQFPRGRQAEPWPTELPKDSRCVPTFHSNRQTPVTATRQLDHVFATPSIVERLTVTALNGVGEWGPSDHCRIQIALA
jgi:hypothetical protein